MSTNFIVIVNLKEQNIHEGDLKATLFWDEPLEDKKLMLMVPVYSTVMTMDKDFKPTVQTVSTKQLEKRKSVLEPGVNTLATKNTKF